MSDAVIASTILLALIVASVARPGPQHTARRRRARWTGQSTRDPAPQRVGDAELENLWFGFNPNPHTRKCQARCRWTCKPICHKGPCAGPHMGATVTCPGLLGGAAVQHRDAISHPLVSWLYNRVMYRTLRRTWALEHAANAEALAVRPAAPRQGARPSSARPLRPRRRVRPT